MAQNPITIKERSTDGRTVRLDFGPFTLDVEQAHAFAFALSHAANHAENADDRHERHIDLRADCPLCVYEAHGQTDRLTYDDDDDDEEG